MGAGGLQGGRRTAVGMENIGGTEWREVPSGALATVEGLGAESALSATIDFVAPGPDGNPGKPGEPVQILAIDPVTGQCSGTSFTIPRT